MRLFEFEILTTRGVSYEPHLLGESLNVTDRNDERLSTADEIKLR